MFFRKFVLGKYQWRSFEDFASEASIVSQALRNLGLNPRDKVAILAETRAEWILTAYACFKNNITIAQSWLKFFFKVILMWHVKFDVRRKKKLTS